MNIDGALLSQSLESLTEQLSTPGLDDALQRVLDATRHLFGATGAGFMMVDDSSSLRSVAFTDPGGRLLEELQERVGHGPCVDALTFDRVVTTVDVAEDPRWPQLGSELREAGVRAVLGVPIHVSGLPVGSLNVYRNRPGDWGETEAPALLAYGRLVESLMVSALHAEQRERLADQLQHALDSRVVIERAVGMLMERHGLDAVDAFNQLRRTARDGGRRVADVATDMLVASSPDPRA